ncbi:MAG: LytTR family DNA-binding domain-containing protein [Marinilabiliales bacterium]|nr:LytTR family DNA-binding domain-containing protein [Marinilabiliales bacterium]
MKILIIEDEVLAARRLSQMILSVLRDATLTGPLDTVRSAVEHLSQNQSYDLIFMDIQLADGKSFSIFEEVRIVTPVIFTTAYDEFALRAFEHNSIDYLLKPVKQEKLTAALDKFQVVRDYFVPKETDSRMAELISSFRSRWQPAFKDRFLINRGDAMVSLRIDEVACIFAEEKAVFLMTHDNKRHLIPNSIEELADRLDPKRFFRVNRQYILSVDAIRKVHNHFNFKLKVELKANPHAEIFVSRSRSAQFKAWMNGETQV